MPYYGGTLRHTQQKDKQQQKDEHQQQKQQKKLAQRGLFGPLLNTASGWVARGEARISSSV